MLLAIVLLRRNRRKRLDMLLLRLIYRLIHRLVISHLNMMLHWKWNSLQMNHLRQCHQLRSFINSSYCLRAKKGEVNGDNSVIYMRDHSCYCSMCASGEYESCTQTDIVGKFKKIVLKRKVVPKIYESMYQIHHY